MTNQPRCANPRRFRNLDTFSRRKAFTLVELLVVIAIIGVMISLLLPAVQSAREASRRMQCSNRMRQTGLAIHNYHSAFRRLPRAFWLDTPPRALNGKPWSVSILPFIEQQSLHEQYDHSRLAVDQLSPTNVALIQTLLADFICPSSPNSAEQRRYTMNAASAGFPLTATNIAPCDFTPSTGVRGVYSQLAYGSNPPPAREGALQVVSALLNPNGQDGEFSAILDGLSNTLLLGERTGGPTVYTGGRENPTATQNLSAVNGGGWGDIFAGDHWLEGSPHGGFTWPPQGGPCAINCTNALRYGFHSFHQGGAHFLTADGAVRFVTQTVNARAFSSLVTRRGREVGDAEL